MRSLFPFLFPKSKKSPSKSKSKKSLKSFPFPLSKLPWLTRTRSPPPSRSFPPSTTTSTTGPFSLHFPNPARPRRSTTSPATCSAIAPTLTVRSWFAATRKTSFRISSAPPKPSSFVSTCKPNSCLLPGLKRSLPNWRKRSKCGAAPISSATQLIPPRRTTRCSSGKRRTMPKTKPIAPTNSSRISASLLMARFPIWKASATTTC